MSPKAEASTVAYGGWSHNVRLSNGEAEALVTLDVGPRILRYGPVNGENLLKEVPEDLGKSGEPGWIMRGGHRLWTSPEDPVRTYVPDNGPVTHQVHGAELRVTTPADGVTGLERTMILSLADRGTRLDVRHTITNRGKDPVTIAAWALTVMAPGGIGLFPLPPSRKHPGLGPATAEDFAPQTSLALWPYFRFSDPRFSFGDRFIRLRQDATMQPTKIGLAMGSSWAGYLRNGTLFVKTVPHVPGSSYPDFGCNFESYSDAGILELETLGPLTALLPGASVTHNERWAFLSVNAALGSDDDLARELLPRVEAALF